MDAARAFPHVQCETCIDALASDNIEPPCFGCGDEPGETACWVPEPDQAGRRALWLRQKLLVLQPLVGGEAVLNMYGATLEDLDLISAIEELDAAERAAKKDEANG